MSVLAIEGINEGQNTLEQITVIMGQSIYHAQDDSDFAIFRANLVKGKDEVKVKGAMPGIKAGAVVDLHGCWELHSKHGLQFAVSYYTIPTPDNKEGIIAFLCSIRGIKRHLAESIVSLFGASVYDVLDQEPERLLEIRGIGLKKYETIIREYEENRVLRHLITFLGQIQVPLSQANKIYRAYGKHSIDIIKSSPYQLAKDIRGIGFKQCDHIALRLGITPNSEDRFIAGIDHVLNSIAGGKGHCYLSSRELSGELISLLAIPNQYRPSGNEVLKHLERAEALDVVHRRELENGIQAVYPLRLWVAEKEVTKKLSQLVKWRCSKLAIQEWTTSFERKHGIMLAERQRDAVALADQCQLMMLTGGAGCGKSLTAKVIYELWKSQKLRIVACAPTGRAAQRMKESIGISAKTIHRLLEYNGQEFLRNHENPINADAFLVDEGAMINISLFHQFLRAVPPYARVCIIGDPHQLPPIGPGVPFLDMLKSEVIPQVTLEKIFRQGSTSNIIPASMQIREGQVPTLSVLDPSNPLNGEDTLYLEAKGELQIKNAIKYLLQEYLPHRGFQMEDIQILSPMNKYGLGNDAINLLIQDFWNPSQTQLFGFRKGDKIIQTSNNYHLDIYNGDIGWIEDLNMDEEEILVRFEDKKVVIDRNNIDDLKLAYSISIHKSQGSEFPVVILPMTMSHAFMLNRNLFYTGFTRAKKLVIVVGEQKAINYAVRKEYTTRRNTDLSELLKKEIGHRN